MDRRRFLGLSAAGAGAVALARLGVRPVAASPAVTPFTRDLVVPPVAVPVSTSGGVDRYQIEQRVASVSILDGLSTTIWGYDGLFPGPTIAARSGRPVSVTFASSLPVDSAIHLHGGHVAPEHDGHPHDFIPPGGSRVYEYPNAQPHSTLWYHDHAMMRTAQNIWMGLAGLYVLQDDHELSLGLPAGDHDVPLLLQDRSFTSSGALEYPEPGSPRRRDGVTGDVFLVNGVPFPRLQVDRVRYRFRIVNASNMRPYELRLSGRSMTQIASDGGLLAAPVVVPSVTLGIAERAEVVIDFSTFDAGDEVELQDAITGQGVVRFDVAGSGSGGGALPATLRTIDELPAPTRERQLLLSFDEARGEWVLNGRPFDHHRIEFRPRLGSTERWVLVNDSTFMHPFHLHLVMFRVLQRGLANPPAAERGWKDTVRVAPGETVHLAARFTGHTGTYLFHCHVLEHEDHSMMGQMRVVDLARRSGSGRVATAAAVAASSFAGAVPAVHVATATHFADALAGGAAAAAAGGPLLLVQGDAVEAATAAELARLDPERIVVLGGTGAVSAAAAAELGKYAPVTRIAGQDRYATAAAVAATVPSPTVVYVASGTGFADALAGGAAAAGDRGVLLLTARDALPDATRRALEELAPVPIVVLGGSAAVSAGVEAQLAAYADGAVRRFAGADRYATAVAVSEARFPAGAGVAYVATGEQFPDALAAAPAVAVDGGSLLLTPRDSLPAVVAGELRRLGVARIVVLGGPGAVSDAGEDALAELL